MLQVRGVDTRDPLAHGERRLHRTPYLLQRARCAESPLQCRLRISQFAPQCSLRSKSTSRANKCNQMRLGRPNMFSTGLVSA
jgi:hypothetical protein